MLIFVVLRSIVRTSQPVQKIRYILCMCECVFVFRYKCEWKSEFANVDTEIRCTTMDMSVCECLEKVLKTLKSEIRNSFMRFEARVAF